MTRLYNFLGLMLLGVISVTVFMPLTLSFLPHLVGLIGCGLLWVQHKKRPHCDWPFTFILLAISALAMLSSLWSITPDISFHRSIKVTAELLLSIPFLMLLQNVPPDTFRNLKSYFAVPLIAAALILCIELTFNFPLSHFFLGAQREISTWQLNKHVTTLILLAPFGLSFALENHKRILAGLLAFMCLGVLVVTVSQAAQLAALVMVLAIIGFRLFPRLMLPLCIGGAAFLCLAMPFIAPFAYNNVADMIGEDNIFREACTSTRLEVWDFISARIMENPWTGFGIDTTRSMVFHGHMIYYKDTSILHPHNIALQLWIEFGLAGAAL
ncbi:MAG: O-antigen ligase family protein, partial [Pseudomonadota bacterium]